MKKATLNGFLRGESGAMTYLGIATVVLSLLVGSYALDVGSLEQQRTLLQVTADSVAHDALVTRELESEADAQLAAITRSEAMMNPQIYGDVIGPTEVVFGIWDRETRKFTPSPGSRSAVQVVARRTSANHNAISTYLMRLVGITKWEVVTGATFATYQPFCLREGFVAEGVVDIQSNNSYLRRFCIHANDHVKLSSNNFFEAGTIVSMPNIADLELPNSGFRTNVGLVDALKEGSINIRVLRRINKIIADVGNPTSPYYPSFLTSALPVNLAMNRIDATHLLPGRVHYWDCAGPSGGTIENGTLISDVVIIANCEVKLGNGSAMEDGILLTTSTSANSVNSPNGFRLGTNDGCTPGGGGRIVTLGGAKFAAGLEIYGSQILAMGDVEFAANADGIEGASIVSNGNISGTSNMSMSYCGGGMDEFTAEYFQLVN